MIRYVVTMRDTSRLELSARDEQHARERAERVAAKMQADPVSPTRVGSPVLVETLVTFAKILRK